MTNERSRRQQRDRGYAGCRKPGDAQTGGCESRPSRWNGMRLDRPSPVVAFVVSVCSSCRCHTPPTTQGHTRVPSWPRAAARGH